MIVMLIHFIYFDFTTKGRVSKFEYHKSTSTEAQTGTGTLTPDQLNTIAHDLTEAFSEEANMSLKARTKKTLRERVKIMPGDIQDVYVFTWLKMKTAVRRYDYFSFI